MVDKDIERALSMCADGVHSVNSAYVATVNEMSDDDIEKRGIESVKREVACVQAVEAAFSFGMITFAGVLHDLIENGDVPDEVKSFVVSNKVMSSILAVMTLLKDDKAFGTFDEYLSRARKEAGSIEEMSELIDVAYLKSLLDEMPDKGESLLEEVKDDIMASLKKAKGKEGK